MFPVIKPRLPDLRQYMSSLEEAHERAWLTNFGPLHDELAARLEAFLGVRNLLLVANGTIALQVAYRVLGLSGRVLTTPFSFVATAATLVWEGLEPAFVDIDPGSFNLDPDELASQEPGSGIVAVHVYGNPCDVEAIERFASPRGMPVIYDAAHAFGSELNGESVLGWGDAATLSFHATKLFHTIEGGAIIFRNRDHYEEARSLINFGLREGGGIESLGTNAKLSEYHAAAGLTLLDETRDVIARRSELVETYRLALDGWVDFQVWHAGGRNNGAYMPILLADEEECLRLKQALEADGIQTRRYFHPSLNTLPYLDSPQSCPRSEAVAGRVLCLPLYGELRTDEARAIADRAKHHLHRRPADAARS